MELEPQKKRKIHASSNTPLASYAEPITTIDLLIENTWWYKGRINNGSEYNYFHDGNDLQIGSMLSRLDTIMQAN